MLEQAVQAGEAMRLAALHSHETLIPALSGCRTCRTARMITAPVLGVYKDCGAELTLLSGSNSLPTEHRKPLTRAA
jgi:hypothetical protein